MSANKSVQLKAGTILTYVQLLVSMLISLIYTPVMLRLLGQTEYGLYNIAATTVSYVNILNMGFASSYVRFYSRDKAKNDQNALASTNGLFLLVFICIGIISFVAGIILSASAELIFKDGLTNSEYIIAKKIIIILTISTSYNLATSLFSSMITAHEEFIFLKLVNLIKTIVSPALIWILLIQGYKSVMMAVVTSALIIVSDTFYVLFALFKLKVRFKFNNINKMALAEVTAFSGFIAINTIVDQINWSIDKILLGRFWGARYTAIYSVGAQINSIYMQLSTGISNVFIPRINKVIATKQPMVEVDNLFIKIGRLQTLVLLPVITGFIFFGQQFITIWTPDGYSDAYYIALFLMVPATIPYIQNAGVTIQTAMNKHQFRAVLYGGMAIINFVISILLCKRYGGIGCAFGTAFSIFVANIVIMNIYYQNGLKLNIKRFWRELSSFIPTILILSCAGLAIKLFVKIDNYCSLLIFAILYLIIYIFSAFFLSLNNYEKDLVSNIFKRMVKEND